MELWIKVFEVMFPVIAVVSVGYFFGKMTNVNMKPVNIILLYLSTPCLIFTSLTEDRVQFIEILNIVYIGTLLVLIGVPITYFLLRTFKKDPKVFLNPIIFPNTANLGLPVVLFAFGDAAFDYAILFTTIVFFLHCSFGILFINGISNIKEVFKIPLIYTVALALTLNNFEVEVYKPLNISLDLIGTTCIPLMMFSLGHKLSETKIINLKSDMFLSAIRLSYGFIISLIVCNLFNIDNLLVKVFIIQYSMPSAVFNYILADKYDKSTDRVASIVFVSTVMSLVTIPFILYFLMK